MSQDVATSAAGTSPHRRRRMLLLAAIAVALVVATAVVAVSWLSNNGTGPPTVRVDRGQVSLAVSASGSITPSGQQSLGFADGGTVTQVLVQVGDRVEPGQVLARVDDTVARQTLAQRRATLDQQAATLNKLVGGNTVEAAQATLDQARQTLDATQAQVDATNEANQSATSRARTQLAFDQSSLRQAQDQLQADRASCRASPRATTSTTAPPATGAPTTTRVPPATAGAPTTTAVPPRPPTTTSPPTTSRPPATTPTTSRAVRLAAFAGSLDSGANSDTALADSRTGAACSRLLSDRQGVQQAEGTVVQSRTALEAAEQRERTDAAAGQVSLENARTSVVSAENQLGTAGNDRPNDIAAQQAQVDDARAAVVIAQQDVDQTVITAPVAGTITAINGAPGEVVSAPTAVTPLAPGGAAPLPVSSTSGAGTGSSGGGASAPGAGAFVVLNAADPFQLVVPFEETDAARITPGQRVNVSVDALPDDTVTGRVTSVAPSGQDLSGIISYYATVVVEGGAERLRDGQTAEAAVQVESVDDVLRVPASAVRRENGRPTVTVTGPDGEPTPMPFLPGLVGDDYVEVRSGLSAGEQVELPQATVTPGPDNQGPPPN